MELLNFESDLSGRIGTPLVMAASAPSGQSSTSTGAPFTSTALVSPGKVQLASLQEPGSPDLRVPPRAALRSSPSSDAPPSPNKPMLNPLPTPMPPSVQLGVAVVGDGVNMGAGAGGGAGAGPTSTPSFLGRRSGTSFIMRRESIDKAVSRAKSKGAMNEMREFLDSFSKSLDVGEDSDGHHIPGLSSDGAISASTHDGARPSSAARPLAHGGLAGSVGSGSGSGAGAGPARAPARLPREYREEHGLSPAVAKGRKRLAARFSSLGFPFDGCMQSLKETGCDLDKTCRLLLYYYPRGDGMRTMVHNLTALIKKVETKMRYVLEDIQASVNSGTPEERLATLRTHFDACDEGDKEYLSPAEFAKLTATLGASMSDAELHEALATIDDNGDGQVDLIEYVEWWSEAMDDDEVLELFRRIAAQRKRSYEDLSGDASSGGNVGGGGAGRAGGVGGVAGTSEAASGSAKPVAATRLSREGDACGKIRRRRVSVDDSVLRGKGCKASLLAQIHLSKSGSQSQRALVKGGAGRGAGSAGRAGSARDRAGAGAGNLKTVFTAGGQQVGVGAVGLLQSLESYDLSPKGPGLGARSKRNVVF